MRDCNLIPLTSALVEMRALTHTPERLPRYQHLWGLVVDGAVPGVMLNRRWHISRADYTAILVSLGLPLKDLGSGSGLIEGLSVQSAA